MKYTVALLTSVLIISTVSAQKKLHTKITKEEATKTVQEQFKGATIEGSELEKEEGKTIWSFDLKMAGKTKEVWIDASTGKIIKTEEESAAQEKDEARVDKAEKAALKKVPGEIVGNTTKKSNGREVRSFEIRKRDGSVVEVDVDAKTNKVVGVEKEDAGKEKKN